MQKGSFVLSLFLWLGERPPCCGSTAEPETSGDGMPLSTPTLGSFSTWSTSPSNIEDVQSATTLTVVPETGSADGNEPGTSDIGDLHPALIFGVPAVLLIILSILLVFLIVRCRKKQQSKQDELGSENCKSPIFEEDTPSVMEIEMEELDKWMNSLKRNAECEYLPPVKEEKDGNANPSAENNKGSWNTYSSFSHKKSNVPRSAAIYPKVETVLLEDQIGGSYVTHRRRSPRRSPSADISPLVSEQDLDTIQPLICCSNRQGGSGKFLSKVTRRRKDQPQRENSDSDTDQLETSAKDAGQT